VGGALARRHRERLADRHGPITLLGRADGRDALARPAGAPIIVTVRNDDLEGVLASVPRSRQRDLVLIQNGMLRPWIAAHGLSVVTRGLLFFAVPRRGAEPDAGGESPFVGTHAELVASWLPALGLPARAASESSFVEVEIEKLIWNCVFGLLCERYDESVGVIVERRADELAAVVPELNAVARAALGLATADEADTQALLARLCQYSRTIGSYRGAVKEWPWRNGWFVSAAHQHGIRTPAHDGSLAAIGRPTVST
jgi:ketopantoate reductase